MPNEPNKGTMLREEKERTYRDYIQSSAFTLSSYSSLSLFQMNIREMHNLVKQESDLAFKLMDSNTEGFDLSYIQLDILSKVMIMIEGQVALISALDSGRMHVAEKMSFFTSRAVEQIATKLDAYGQEQRRAFIWKVSSLPDINTIRNLSEDERLFLDRTLDETARIYYEEFCKCVNFYLCNKIAYNKLKHGLSFLPLMPFAQNRDQSALVMALHKSRRKPEYQANLLPVQGSFMPKDLQWFDTVCVIEVNRKNVEAYVRMAEIIDELVSFVVQNNLLYADNCGADYLPVKVDQDNRISAWLFSRNLNDDFYNKVKIIYSKALPNIRVPQKKEGKFEIHFNKNMALRIDRYLDFFGSAVVWANETNTDSAIVVNKTEML